MSDCMAKYNSNREYDPDFGNKFPKEADVYMVNVQGEINYQLLVLTPLVEVDGEREHLLEQIFLEFLSDGDKVDVTQIDEDIEKHKHLPIISFNPDFEDRLEFFWLRPPKFMMN